MTTPASQWQSIIDGLEKDRAAQCARADRLQLSLDRIAEQMALQADDLRAIRKMLRRRETQLAKAEAEVRKLRRKLGLDDPEPEPDAAEVPDEDESAEEDTDASTDAAPTPSAPRSPKSKTRAEADNSSEEPAPRKPRVGGRRAPPAHIPADHEHYGVCACSRCGGRVLKRDVEQTAVYSAVRSYVRQRIIRRDRVVCADPQCHAATTAPMPPMPCPRALFDCSFLAWLVTMKFGYMIPLDRIQAQLASQGVFLATGTLVHLIERAAALADAVDGEHMKQLRAGKYICFDGTGLKVLIAGQPKAWDGYLEVYTREQVTVFQFDLTKHADELRERLGNLAAILITDAESRNKAGAPNAKFGHCNAHVVRAFRDAARVQPTLAGEGCAFVARLYDVEQEARALGLVGEDAWATPTKVPSNPHRVQGLARRNRARRPPTKRSGAQDRKVLPPTLGRVDAVCRRPGHPDRQQRSGAGVPAAREAAPCVAVCGQHRGRTPMGDAARRGPDRAKARPRRAGLLDLDVRAPRNPQGPVRDAREGANAGRLQGRGLPRIVDRG